MNIEEIKHKRDELCELIRRQLNDFQTDTGCMINKIEYFTYQGSIEGEDPFFLSTKVEISLYI